MTEFSCNFIAGWAGVLMGACAGAVLGLFFYRADWLGGYASFRRRMLRLGHISFFGIGFLNLFFADASSKLMLKGWALSLPSACLLIALVAMPLCCFLTAWKEPFRLFFPLPVIAVLTAAVAVLRSIATI